MSTRFSAVRRLIALSAGGMGMLCIACASSQSSSSAEATIPFDSQIQRGDDIVSTDLSFNVTFRLNDTNFPADLQEGVLVWRQSGGIRRMDKLHVPHSQGEFVAMSGYDSETTRAEAVTCLWWTNQQPQGVAETECSDVATWLGEDLRQIESGRVAYATVGVPILGRETTCYTLSHLADARLCVDAETGVPLALTQRRFGGTRLVLEATSVDAPQDLRAPADLPAAGSSSWPVADRDLPWSP
jgi:hypothetical protein